MESGLYDLLRKCNSDEAKEAGEITNVTTYGPSTKWCLADNSYETFWQKY